MNKFQLHKLEFKNVWFADSLKDLMEFFNTNNTQIKILIFNSVLKLDNDSLDKILDNLKRISTLEELHMINMNLKTEE
jgi:hypothetical protein